MSLIQERVQSAYILVVCFIEEKCNLVHKVWLVVFKSGFPIWDCTPIEDQGRMEIVPTNTLHNYIEIKKHILVWQLMHWLIELF